MKIQDLSNITVNSQLHEIIDFLSNSSARIRFYADFSLKNSLSYTGYVERGTGFVNLVFSSLTSSYI